MSGIKNNKAKRSIGDKVLILLTASELIQAVHEAWWPDTTNIRR